MNDLLTSLADDAPPRSLSVPLQALWWLKKGGLAMGPHWQKAHALCQQGEGERGHDVVHGLAHWIEGDATNSAYWYRRAGETRAATVAAEWERIVASLGG
jgi:hypothetical protein